MGPFEMVVAIVAIVFFFKTIEAVAKSRGQRRNDAEMWDDVRIHIENVEKRIANLETIVLDKEKERAFDDAF